MSANQIKTISERSKIGLIFVDSYENKLIQGRIQYESLGTEQRFNNLISLLFLIEKALDRLDFPDAYTKIKHFASPFDTNGDLPSSVSEMDQKPENGALATFALKVIFRHNASWQGIVTWVDGHREESFRSVYELIVLMDSALENTFKH